MTSPPQIRLTGTSYAVLTLLHHLGEATPYDLKQALERSIANFWPVPHTTFYAEPSRLLDGGYLNLRQERHGRRRKLYSLTDAGKEALRAWANSPQIAQSQVRDEGTLKIFAGADPRVVFAQQRQWRADKLTELEGYLDALEGAPENEHTAAIRVTLLTGIVYERKLIEAIDEFFAQADVEPLTREEALAMGGTGWEGNLDRLRSGYLTEDQAATDTPPASSSGNRRRIS